MEFSFLREIDPNRGIFGTYDTFYFNFKEQRDYYELFLT